MAAGDIIARVTARLVTAGLLKPLKAVQQATKRANVAMMTQVRRTAQVGIAMSQVFGVAIDQSLSMGIEAALLSLELLVVTQAAYTAGTLGMNAFRITAMSAAIISMIVAIANMEGGKTKNANVTRSAVAGFRLMAY